MFDTNVADALKIPSDFGYRGDLPIGRTWALGPVIRHRDSALLEECNADALEETLRQHNEFDDLWDVTRARHWAVGWVEHLSYQAVDEAGNPTAIHQFLVKWSEKLEDYPIADEDLYSERLFKAQIESIQTEGFSSTAEGVPEDWANQVYTYLSDSSEGALEHPDGYVSASDILPALRVLGFYDTDLD